MLVVAFVINVCLRLPSATLSTGLGKLFGNRLQVGSRREALINKFLSSGNYLFFWKSLKISKVKMYGR